MDVTHLTLRKALKGLEEKKFSSFELTRAYLERIEKYNPVLNAFITVRGEEALREAKRADKLMAQGVRKPLLGIPIGLKDNWVTKGVRTTAAEKVLDNYIPQYDATAVVRLKEAGAVIIGKLNLDAWGHGSSGEHSAYGNILNPWSYEHVPGGSSSGSGAAVAADLCLAATGTDTGGSIRQPAANCNLVGLKPTYGRVSRYGIIAMASSTDTVGHLAKTVWDSARFLHVTAGRDPLDATSAPEDVPDYEEKLDGEIGGMRIGVPKEYFTEGVEETVKKLCSEALKVLEGRGAELVEISLPHTKYAYAVYVVIQTSEVSSNLLRYDGRRYGQGREKFGEEAKRRIMIGTHSLSAGYHDRYYRQALKGRTLIRQDFDRAYEKVDVIACPVWPFPPFKFGERVQDPLQMYLSDVFTVTANLSGNPSLSVPVGFTGAELPVGMQFIGPNYREDLIHQVGFAYEQETEFYKKKPPLLEAKPAKKLQKT
jgi:aspartyl-tRNA(Asn)/glutamyl-tRNA(Gln) amidotransferase subunit A